VDKDTAIDMTLGTALLAVLPASTGAVTLTIVTKTVTIFDAATGFGTIWVIGAGGSDPIARFGDVRREFELPPGVMTTLVEAPDLLIRGSVFEGGGPWEQWFNTIVLTLPWQDRFLEIKVRENLHEFNASKVPRSAFQTVDIAMGYRPYGTGRAINKLKGFGDIIPSEFLSYDIAFRKIKRHYTHRAAGTIGTFQRECMDVAGPYMHFYICSSPATEYYGHQRDLSLKYAHLNMFFMEVKNYTALTGLLPELWGVHPMSESTKASVKEEAPQAPKLAAASSDVESAWAGGLGMENITKNCFDQNETNVKLVVSV